MKLAAIALVLIALMVVSFIVPGVMFWLLEK